jgi:CheY-like chemotaxis protein
MSFAEKYAQATALSEVSEKLASFFFKRMNILIVEDDDIILRCLEDFLSTSFIHVETALNAENALVAIASTNTPWHCWIIDMGLGKLSGLAILEENRQFPFAIIHSGTGSMEQAALAMKLGAADVIDKSPNSMYKVILKICKLIPLSVLCKGFLLKNISAFFLLKENIILDHTEWAYRANVSLRQLQNICNLHTGMPPTFVIPFYYGLQYLLSLSFDSSVLTAEFLPYKPFLTDCLNFIEKNLSYYQNFI